MHEGMKKPMMKMMVVIIDRDRAKMAMNALQEMHARFSIVCDGFGTATSDIMDILGLDSNEKAIMLYLEPDFRMDALLAALSRRMELHHPGKGIAFTMPLSGVGHQAIHMLHPQIVEKWHEMLEHEVKQWDEHIEREVEKMKADTKHDLIVAVVNHGFSDELVAAAKAAGATGGTVVPARQVGLEGAMKFFGISVQGEKEIVAILAESESKRDIMMAIGKQCGMATEARGIVFSMPVDSIAGL